MMASYSWRRSSSQLRTFHLFLSISILSLFIPQVFPQSAPSNLTDFIELDEYELPEDEETQTPEEPDYPPGSTSLTFVFDTTGSMHDDLMKVQEGATRILETTTSNADTPLYNFVLVPFHDPRVGPVTETQDQSLFLRQLNDIYVHGGGDCPEMSVTAIKVALELSLPGSQIYVFTDARSKDYNKTNQVLKLIQEKESQVVFVLTGDCNESSHEGYQAYEQIAATSSGQVFLLNKSDVEEVLRFVELSVQTRKVHLISTDMKQGAVQYHWLPVDTRLRQFTISVSGDNPNIMLRGPGGEVIPVLPNNPDDPPDGPYLEELLTLGKAYIVAMRNSTPGLYRLNISSTSSSTLRVQGISLLDFSYGFSREPTTNLNHTSRLPLRGVRSQLLISADELLPRGYLKKVEFLDLRGHIIPGHEYTLEPDPTQEGVYTVPDITPPGDYFHIRVKGIDGQNYNFQRITAAAVSPLVPAAPLPRMPARTPGFFGKMATLRCFVDSMLPFTVEWRRGEEVIGMTEQYSDSSLVEFDVGTAHSRVEGIYSCIAHSRDMNKPLKGRADTFLDVTEPPPLIQPPSNVTAVPGRDALLTCEISSTVHYNVTWDRPGSPTSLRENSRVFLLRSGSLIIRNVQPEDTGRYRCIARNEGGYSFDYVPLLVQEPPQVASPSTNITFKAWDNATLSCFATGVPQPRITWTKDGLPLPDDSRVVDSGNGRLFLRSMTPNLAGTYHCLAINDAGSASLPIYVTYTEVPSITTEQNEYLVAPDQTATLQCRATGSPPPRIMWFKNGMDLSHFSYVRVTDEGDLVIRSANIYDQGEYMCVAANEAGSDSMPVTLEVGSEPRIIHASSQYISGEYGQNVTLSCLAEGHPEPTIRWEKIGEGFFSDEGRIFILPNGHLYIQELAVEDRGTYICHARNDFGSAASSTRLRVTGLAQPSIGAVSPSETVTEGNKVSLLCEIVMGNPPPVIEWYRDGRPLTPEVGRQRLEYGRLVIESAHLSDSGRYTCIATNEVGNASVSTQLIVQVPPVIDGDARSTYQVIEGKSERLMCPVSGFPKPEVQWLFNGVEVSNNDLNHYVDDQGALVIAFATNNDVGLYVCRVTNAAGRDRLDIAVQVLVPPTIDGPDSLVSLNATEFSSVTLPCVVRSNPPSEITWTRNGEVLPFSGRDFYQSSSGSLIIQRVEQSDQGFYACIATNQAGNVTKNIELEVHVIPRIRDPTHGDDVIVFVGDTLNLECEVYGNPEPTISWQKDGAKVKFHKRRFTKEEDGTFRIRNVRPGDRGTYTCIASNDAGNDRRAVRVNVYIAPNVTDPYQAFNAYVNRDVTLYCPATGFPDPEIEWFVNDVPISPNDLKYSIDESLGSLEILSTSVEDTAVYECVATNPAGSASGEFELTVIDPPSVQNDTIHVVRVRQGETADLSCDIQGTPPPVISWEMNNQPISVSSSALVLPDDTLRLSRAKASDAGYYTCTATNIGGRASIFFQLEVLVPPSIEPGDDDVTSFVGEAIRLDCDHDGYPQPDVVWMKDEVKVNVMNQNKYVVREDGSLTIYGLQEIDSGEYTCIVGNEAGVESKNVGLTVWMAPTILDLQDDYTVLYRSSITLHCEADGVPPPRTEWLKDGVPLSEDDVRYFASPSGSLRITSTVRSDSGNYSCLVFNPAGRIRKDMNLIVLVPPEFTDEGEDKYNFHLNQNISLPCAVDSYPPPDITWYKNGEQLSFITPRIVIMSDSLDIPRAKVSDSGLYRCVATHPAGNITRTFNVAVQVAPKIGNSPTLISARVGQDVVLPCEAIGVPVPMVMWTKGGEKYPSNDDRFQQLSQGSLSIQNVKEGDSGKYLCIAASDAGSDSRFVSLEVNDPPRIVNILPSSLAQPLNSLVMLPCEAEGSPRPDVEWYKSGKPIEQFQNGYTITTEGSLIISSLQPIDNGEYTCMVFNQYGNDSQSISVDTQVRPHIVGENTESEAEVVTAVQGETVTLECNVTDAHPPADITWYRDSRPLHNAEDLGLIVDFSGRLLSIPHVQNQDTGHYYCIARNSVGNGEKHFLVNVQEGPVISNPLWEEITVQAGEDVSFPCSARGIPLPRISWHFDDIPLASTNQRYTFHSSDGSIDMRHVEVIDTGLYTCVAKNRAGATNRTIVLTVQVPPSINNGRTDIVRPEGADVILPCEAGGVPVPEVTWEKDGEPLNISGSQFEQHFLGSLGISSLQAADAGSYVCTARNDAGVASRTISLRVNTPPFVDPTIPKMTTSSVNENVVLQCPITGTPTPFYRWKKNNRNLRFNPRKYRFLDSGLRLMIMDASLLDSGEYECIGRNQAGVKSVDVTLQVTAGPVIRGTQESEDYPVHELDSIDLQCFMEEAYPPPTIEWYYQGQLVSENDLRITLSNNDQVLRIEGIQPQDAGEYYCLVRNAVSQTKRTWNVDVHVGPTIDSSDSETVRVFQNQYVSLPCVAEGNPKPSISWSKDGVEIQRSDGRYRIDYDGTLGIRMTDSSDSGEYVCTASNIAGEESKIFTLQVLVPPRILQEADTIYVTAGFPAYLHCQASGFPSPTITWEKNMRLVTSNVNAIQQYENGTLMINSTRLVDSGVYMCIAENEAGLVHRETQLVVNERPFIPTPPSTEREVVKGEDLVLHCQVFGSPLPTIRWMKNDQLVDPALVDIFENGTMIVPSVQPSDSGEYICFASNMAGNSSITYEISVHVPPSIVDQETSLELSIFINEDITLFCEVEEGTPSPRITWYKDGRRIDSNGQDIRLKRHGERLYIRQAQVTNSGRYTCLAENVAGRAEKFYGLLVMVPPSFVNIIGNGGNTQSQSPLHTYLNPSQYSRLALHCDAGGIPPPVITWMKDGEALLPQNLPNVTLDGQWLYVSSLDEDHAGLYTCVASSIAGNASKHFTVDVLMPPDVVDSDIIKNVTTIMNIPVDLVCETDPEIPGTISWYHNGRKLEKYDMGKVILKSGNTLRILNPLVEDGGEYYCEVTNDAGVSSKFFSLEVHVPGQTIDGSTDLSVVVGSSVTLECQGYGYPPPIISWTKDGNEITNSSTRYTLLPGGTLVISEISTTDAGLYECTVSNIAGEQSRSVTLEVQEPPRILTSIDRATAIINSSADLPCVAEGTPKPVITWRKDRQRIDVTDGYAILDSGTLRIERAELEDTGLFSCVAQNEAGSDSMKFIFEVQVPPEVIPYQVSYSVSEYSPVTLDCFSTGIPEPKTKWFFEGVQLSTSSFQYNILSSGSLEIPYVRREDAGGYYCIAYNPAGEDRGLRFLDVEVPPVIVPVSSPVSVNESQDITLHCETTGIPLPTVTWMKNGQTIPGDQRTSFGSDNSLTITDVQSSDAGMYTCVANSDAGRDSLQIELIVNVPPMITFSPSDKDISSGDRLEMTCQATGFPTPVFRWFLNRTEIHSPTTTKEGRSTLVRENVMKEDGGTYMCRAENVAGSTFRVFGVNVRAPPHIIEHPRSVETPNGTFIEMRCNIEGDPQPRVLWYRGEQTVTSNHRTFLASNGSLIIFPTMPEDSGEYKCRAYNEYGMIDSNKAALRIESPPSFLVVPFNTTVAKEEQVLLDCMAYGDPNPTVTWRKDNLFVTPTSGITILSNNSLLILAARPSDTGAYTCEAYNTNGAVSVVAYVTVRVDGGWSDWTDWASCSTSCGDGMQSRIRVCNNPEPANGGRQCSGPSLDSQPCEEARCPINGRYSDWSVWSQCSVTCGTGTKTRERECNNPPPQFGGERCRGSSTDYATCNLPACPVDGQWGSWSPWQPCSRSCGEGIRQRFRRCDSPPPTNGGASCEGSAVEEMMCKIEECPVNGGYSDWSDWSTCSLSCGGGVKSRTRTCSNPAPAFNGEDCKGPGTERQMCMLERCPIHGGWSRWGSWSICSATCDGGFQERYRSCNNPEPLYNGRECPGNEREQRTCNQFPCSTDGNWGPWSSWSECSATCGESVTRKVRLCNNPAPRNGGQRCIGDTELVRKCDVPPCVVGPRRVFAQVIGNLSGVQFGNGIMLVNISNEEEDQTRIRARVHNVPAAAGHALKVLLSVMSPAYWSSAFEVNDAVNGYTLTQGRYNSNQEVQFSSGEKVTMGISSSGVDADGTLRVLIVVNGETPEFYENDNILFLPWTERYIQTGPGELYASTSKMISVNGGFFPIAWNSSITYNSGRTMPYLVQRVSTQQLQMEYQAAEQSIGYGLRVYVSKGDPSNQCPQGFNLDQTGPYCVDSDECASRVCSHGCSNFPGGYVCTCPNGFKRSPGDQHSCEDVDECRFYGRCLPNQRCKNIIGSFLCLDPCPGGYESGPNFDCRDVNECTMRQGLCSHQCVNTPGSYRCECTRGYRLHDRHTCIDINECSEGRDNCQSGEHCFNTQGSFRCRRLCQRGFGTARNGSCADIDECRLNIDECGYLQTCRNLWGGYECVCPQGYRVERRTCVDINECLQLPCDGQCINLPGDYECECRRGMVRLSDRKSCTGRESFPYEAFSSRLQCSEGYQYNREENRCEDIDECRLRPCQGLCTNIDGSYYCSCPPGYRLLADQRSCQDINECELNTDRCSRDETCLNTQGSYRCEDLTCPMYYYKSGSRDCVLDCPFNNPDCANLDGRIKFHTVDTSIGLQQGRDLILLTVVRENDGTVHSRSHFQIIDQREAEEYCNCQVPFGIRNDARGGVVFTTQALTTPNNYRIKVRARGYRSNNEIEYQTTFILFITVSAYTYS
ncbi:Hemicentin-1 [Holothuria leucospilota]|uniref:Hemicentin-1 n=1 Tax=Holothuria leucospilota TaxID=206669 RepID=A0A9Q1HB81_HOLLE|nr:Hemicentin-1 [Holothuria leucospilota]